MERTRTCMKCGWVHPAQYTKRCCRFCSTVLREGYCPVCGVWNKLLSYGYCSKCSQETNRKYLKRVAEKAQKDYEQWLEDIKKIPTPYKTLTEEQWLEACAYFNGCAKCGNLDISARGMFIAFNNGGRYCNWNVIPLCEECATVPSKHGIRNPFAAMQKVLNAEYPRNSAKSKYSKEKLNKITEYLGARIEGAQNETK